MPRREHHVRLLWLPAPRPDCPACGGTIISEEHELQLDFQHRIVVLRGPFGRCVKCGRVLGAWTSVQEALRTADLDAADVVAFTVDALDTQVEVWLVSEGRPAPWETHREHTREYDTHDAPQTPTLTDVAALPVQPFAWAVVQQPGVFIRDDAGQPQLAHVGLVVQHDGFVRAFAIHPEPLGVTELTDLILRACQFPPEGGRPVRPGSVLVDNPFVLGGLTEQLRPVGIAVEVGQSRAAQDAMTALLEYLSPVVVPPYLSRHDERDVRLFFDTARKFFTARAWEKFAPDSAVAFRQDDGPWQYASVIGQMGETEGVSVFRDWLSFCRFNHNADELFSWRGEAEGEGGRALLAAGGMEGVTLGDVSELAPEDADVVRRLNVKATWRKQLAVVHRYAPGGLESPTVPPRSYAALLEALTARVSSARGERITSIKGKVRTRAGEVELRYPARGAEDADTTSFYRLEFDVPLSVPARRAGLKAARVVVEAPGEAKLHTVAREVTRALKARGDLLTWITTVRQGEFLVWVDQAPVKEPSPTVQQLAALGEVMVAYGLQERPLRITALPRPQDAGIEAHLHVQSS